MRGLALSSPFRVIQITDCHLFGDEAGRFNGVPTRETFERVLQRIRAETPPPGLILATGDLSHDGSEASYRHFAECLAPLGAPVCWLAGNHDHRPTMQRVLNQYPQLHSQPPEYTGGWRLRLLDTTDGEAMNGRVRRADLEDLRNHDPKPTLVAMHHNPLQERRKGVYCGLINSAETLRALLRAPAVKAVVYGHIHQALRQRRGGISLLATPSTGYQSKTRSGKPAKEGPGYRILDLWPAGEWRTRVVRVGRG